MSVEFTVLNAEGKAIRSGCCPEADMALQAGPGESVVQGPPEEWTEDDVERPGLVISDEARRAAMTLTPRQMLLGLMSEGWITEAEAEAWATSSALPAAVETLIATLPQGERTAARITCLKMGVVERADPFVSALATLEGKTAAEIDTFFTTYSGV